MASRTAVLLCAVFLLVASGPLAAQTITEFPVPSAPGYITAGSDGHLWFAARGDKIVRMTTTGNFTEFPLPAHFDMNVYGLTSGPDGNVWYVRSRSFVDFDPPAVVIRILAGPDDALWFTESSADKIGRITTGVVADPTQILPVVGSTMGVGGSFFRTSVQLHNAGTTPSAGGIVFHPSGAPGSVQDPSLPFTLAPGETLTIPDLLPAMDRSGLGSADVILTLGSAGNIPVVSARVFNDAGVAGTTGFAFNAVPAEEALRVGQRGVLLIPSDLTNFRLNLGVRSLNADVLLTLTVRNASGAIAAVVPKFYPAVYHEQQAATAFLNGLALPAGGSITVHVDSGSAILYGATVDNRTGDPSMQVARAVP